MAERTEVYHMEQRYRVVFEQAASTKGVTGFKVEANGDNIAIVKVQATELLDFAKAQAPQLATELK